MIAASHTDTAHAFTVPTADGVDATVIISVGYARLVVDRVISLEARSVPADAAAEWHVTVRGWERGSWVQAGTHRSPSGWAPVVRALEGLQDPLEVLVLLEDTRDSGCAKLASEVWRHLDALAMRGSAKATLNSIRRQKDALYAELDTLEAVDDHRFLMERGDDDHAGCLNGRSLRGAPITACREVKEVSLAVARAQLSSVVRKQREVQRSRCLVMHSPEAVARVARYLPDSVLVRLLRASKRWRGILQHAPCLTQRLMLLQGGRSSWAVLRSALGGVLCKLKEVADSTPASVVRTWVVGSAAGVLTLRRCASRSTGVVCSSIATHDTCLEFLCDAGDPGEAEGDSLATLQNTSVRLQGRWVLVAGGRAGVSTPPAAGMHEAARWFDSLCRELRCESEVMARELRVCLGLALPQGFPAHYLGSEADARLREDTMRTLVLPAATALDPFAAEHHLALMLELPASALLDLYYHPPKLQAAFQQQTDDLMQHRVYGERLGDVESHAVFIGLKQYKLPRHSSIMCAATELTSRTRHPQKAVAGSGSP